MTRWLVAFLCILGRLLFKLRYKVTFTGLNEVRKNPLLKKGGVLFLPNHPAHVDPILLAFYLWPKFRFRPLVVESIYRQPWIQKFLHLVGTLPVPNFSTSYNEIKIAKAKQSVDEVIDKIKKGENFLLYPSGRLKHTGKEILGGASATHTILGFCPDAPIVMIRTSGLWGSSFSRAYEGVSPDFTKMVWHGVKSVLKNGIFFTPRRKIHIDLVVQPKDFPKKANRLELNKYLEDWYNQYLVHGHMLTVEPLTRVSYTFYKSTYLEEKKRRTKVFAQLSAEEMKNSPYAKEIFQELLNRFPDAEITLKTHLAQDLGMDSIDVAEIITFLYTHYEVENVHPEEIETVLDLVSLIENRDKHEIEESEKEKLEKTFPYEKKRIAPELPTGKTIPEAFFRMCDRMGSSPACGDDILGVLSYKKLKVSVLALAKEIANLPGKEIGILLPASTAAYLLILATMTAKKIPVMLNWTLGPRYLNGMMKLGHVEKVLTSWKFLERLDRVEFGELTHQVILLEDLKMKISLRKKLSAFMLSWHPWKYLLQKLCLNDLKEEDTAVILFTSGTEAAPKGVPLTHKNILANQRASIQCVEFKPGDTFLGSLPPFHSFGFSVAGLFPLLTGIKVVFSPDPTDSSTLAEVIHRWKATIVCLAPSFLKALLLIAKKEQLSSIRLFVSGAEPTPKMIYEKIKEDFPEALLIQGYGITECSPVLTINRTSLPPIGVGQPLLGVSIQTVHPETKKLLPEGKEGEFIVKGDNVFSGYLGKTVQSPFITIEGEKWYLTGDLGKIDKRGNVILSGRLKRFTKIGGEMVSLAAIEQVLSEQYTDASLKGPLFAVLAKEEEGHKSSLILFTPLTMELKQVNLLLREAGFSPLIRISDIRKIEAIPLMGTGKVDYRYLQGLLT